MAEDSESIQLTDRSAWDEAGSGSDGEGFLSYRGRRRGQARVYRDSMSTQHDEAGPSIRFMPASQVDEGYDDLHPEAWAGRSFSDGARRGMSRKARMVLTAGFVALCYTLYLIRRSSYSEHSQTLELLQQDSVAESPAPTPTPPPVPLPEWLHREPVNLTVQGKLEAVRDITMHAPLLEGDCLEAWIARGEICSGLTWTADAPGDVAMKEARRLGRTHDILFTSVNGSDPRHTAARLLCAHKPKGSWADWRVESNGSVEVQPLRRASSSTLASRDSLKSLGDVVNRYRDHGELRYAVRSAWLHLKALDKIHLFTPDYAAPLSEQPASISSSVKSSSDAESRNSTMTVPLPSELDAGIPSDRFVAEGGIVRRGQLPAWLNISNPLVAIGNAAEQPLNASVRLVLHHDWNLAYPAALQRGSVQEAALLSWKREALPSFNSMALEGMLGGSPGLGEQLLYANDDFFVLKDHNLADVSTPLLGPVLRFQADLGVPGLEYPGEERTGEWRALLYSSWLLDERFGERTRPYVLHVHRTLLAPILAEIRLIWREQLDTLASRRFRGLGREANIGLHFLHHHFLIESHRQALLWSFFVLRIDQDGDGVVSETEWKQALIEMGIKEPLSADQLSDIRVAVRFPERTSLAQARLEHDLTSTGLGMPNHTKLNFTSQDGYPFAALSPFFQSKPRAAVAGQPTRSSGATESFPDFVRGNDPKKLWRFQESKRAPCVIDIAKCASRGKPVVGLRPEELFRRFAVDLPSCGDCFLHLIRQSGRAGVSAFLPESRRIFAASSRTEDRKKGPPHLPLVQRVRPLDVQAEATRRFSANSVAEETGWQGESMRRFAMRLIQRYAYVIGTSSISVRRLQNYPQAVYMLKQLQKSRLEYALLCLNDDLETDTLDREIGAFGESKWPLRAPFEL